MGSKEVGSGFTDYDFSEFVGALMDEIEKLSGGGVTILHSRDINVSGSDYICVKKNEQNVLLIGNAKDYYAMFLEDGDMGKIAGLFVGDDTESGAKPVASLALGCFEDVKDNIVYGLINRELNTDFLRTAVHDSVLGGLEKIYRVLLTPAQDVREYMVSMCITKGNLDMWGVTEEEVKALAEVNTPRIFKPVIRTMRQILASVNGEYEPEGLDAEDYIYLVSTCEGVNGSAVMLYPDVLRQYSDLCGGCDWYVVPCGVEDLILQKVMGLENEGECVREAMRHMNKESVGIRSFLCNDVFYYSRKKDSLDVAV